MDETQGGVDDAGGWDEIWPPEAIGTSMTPVADDDPRLPDPNLGARLYRERHPHDHGIVRSLP